MHSNTLSNPVTPANITQDGDLVTVLFDEGVSAIAPGQAAVFYEGDDVVGGGWIMKSFRQTDALAAEQQLLAV